MKGGKSTGAMKKIDAKLFVKKIRDRKDPNKPKRPGSALFLFIMEFRKKFKEENPDYKFVAADAKVVRAKWRSMPVAVSSTLFNIFSFQ
ncbi:putative chromatin remodeling & transcriptional activation HMG family [Helianthus debilis subsp. tardiflorus]